MVASPKELAVGNHPVSGAYCWESGDTDGGPKSISRIKVQTQMECCTCRELVKRRVGAFVVPVMVFP